MTALPEQFTNGSTGTLSADLSSGAATMPVQTLSPAAPATGQMRIQIGVERILITDLSASPWPITRGVDDTSAAGHNAGQPISQPVTKGAFDHLLAVYEGSTLKAIGRFLKFVSGATVAQNADGKTIEVTISGGGSSDSPPDTTPVNGDFSWVNQGGASVTVMGNGSLYLVAPAVAGDNLRMRVKNVPGATPWTVTIRATSQTVGNPIGDDRCCCGMVLYESGTSKVLIHAFTPNLLGDMIQTYSSPTAFVGEPLTNFGVLSPHSFYLQINHDGTHLNFRVSPTGEEFVDVYQRLPTDDFTTAPNKIGFFAQAYSANGPGGIILRSWQES